MEAKEYFLERVIGMIHTVKGNFDDLFHFILIFTVIWNLTEEILISLMNFFPPVSLHFASCCLISLREYQIFLFPGLAL